MSEAHDCEFLCLVNVISTPLQERHGCQDSYRVMLCAAKLVPVGFGIKKLQITCVIEDSKVESMDEIIEDHLVR